MQRRHGGVVTLVAALTALAAVIPPVAAIVGNLGGLDESQLPSGDEQPRTRIERDPDR